MPDRDVSRRARTLASCAAALILPATVNAEPVGFAKDVQPILTKHCVVCHVQGAAQGDLALYPDAWGAVVEVKSRQSPLLLVEPGRPEASYFYLKLTGEHLAAQGTGEQMPSPQSPLAPAGIDIIRQWIAEGAEQD